MTDQGIARKRRVSFQTIRWLVYLLVVGGVAAWKFIPRPWHPSTVLETSHYVISSTATREQTEAIGRAVEILYVTYSNRFGSLKHRYYLHWWTLTHFVFEHPKHSGAALRLMEQGGGVESFEQLIGPIENAQSEWYQHVLRIKSALGGTDPEFRATGALPEWPE